jgi:hypothetical protein
MRKILSSLFTFSLCFLAIDSYCDTISVSEAMEMKLIKVSLNKSKPTINTNSFYGSSYTGDCIIMSIENLTDKNIKVLLEAGRFMEPDDSSEQRMIVTHEQMIALYKKQKKEIPVFAMCSEMHDSAPDSASVFEMSHKAEGDLLTLAQLVSKNNWQDMGAQSAIWAMTDGNDYADIYSDNESEMTTLRDFVKKTKGITAPLQPQGNEVFSINTESKNTYLKYSKGEISGSFEFTNKSDLSLSMILYNDKGEEFRKSFTNMTFKKGNNTLTYTYYYFNIPLGNYYVKLLDGEGNVFLEKMLTFK